MAMPAIQATAHYDFDTTPTQATARLSTVRHCTAWRDPRRGTLALAARLIYFLEIGVVKGRLGTDRHGVGVGPSSTQALPTTAREHRSVHENTAIRAVRVVPNQVQTHDTAQRKAGLLESGLTTTWHGYCGMFWHLPGGPNRSSNFEVSFGAD